MLENGVKRFIYASATVTVRFPVDWHDKEYIRCDKCNFYRETGDWSSDVCSSDLGDWTLRTLMAAATGKNL